MKSAMLTVPSRLRSPMRVWADKNHRVAVSVGDLGEADGGVAVEAEVEVVNAVDVSGIAWRFSERPREKFWRGRVGGRTRRERNGVRRWEN